MRPKHITITALTQDDDGIAEAQQLAQAGELDLDGTAVVDGVAVLNPARRVTLTCSGNLSGVNFTITGKNRAGTPISETLAGPNSTTVATKKVFAEVSSISADGAVGTNVEAGWGVEAVSAPIPLDRYRNPFNVGIGCTVVSGTPTFTVEHTFDDVQDREWNEGSGNWFSHASIEDESTNVDGHYAFAVSAIRIRVTAGPGSVLFSVHQSG